MSARSRRLPRRGVAIAAAALLAAAAVAAVARFDRGAVREAACGEGFARRGPRCVVPAVAASCPSPLVPTPAGCDAPDLDVVEVPAAQLVVGPSDWEAEGKVAPRTIVTGSFAIDRLEVTVGLARRFPSPLESVVVGPDDDPARALSGVTRAEARAFCGARGGRLPTEDEWIVAASGPSGRRYPWGDTGAVCRRGAWGLVTGPCASGADGPDTVGAHPEGRTPSAISDLAGNVAEWVEADARPGLGVVRGGSYASTLATELRTWSRREAPVGARERTIGFRCAYDRGVR